MDAWFAWHYRECFWQVGVMVDGRRLLLVEVRDEIPAPGEALLTLFSGMSAKEIIAWASRGGDREASARRRPGRSPNFRKK